MFAAHKIRKLAKTKRIPRNSQKTISKVTRRRILEDRREP